MKSLNLLYVVEGNTDIRFVAGLTEISDLCILVPERCFQSSQLESRLRALASPPQIVTVPGNRAQFQWRSLVWIWRHAAEFNAILSQELLRGTLNAALVGRLKGVPVAAYVTTPSIEYFRCRRTRRQIGVAHALTGEAVIRLLQKINGALVARCFALGPYLQSQLAPYASKVLPCGYYGVDTFCFRPVEPREKIRLREKLHLPQTKFIALFSSRISHEKDPETFLSAGALARNQGVDLFALNLSGEHEKFVALAKSLLGESSSEWVSARPAVHPVDDLAQFYQAADVVVQSSLSEGLGLSPLEALACGTPVIASDVGGLKQLRELTTLVTPQDPLSMAEAIVAVARDPFGGRDRALLGRKFVEERWNRNLVFDQWRVGLHAMLKDHFFRMK